MTHNLSVGIGGYHINRPKGYAPLSDIFSKTGRSYSVYRKFYDDIVQIIERKFGPRSILEVEHKGRVYAFVKKGYSKKILKLLKPFGKVKPSLVISLFKKQKTYLNLKDLWRMAGGSSGRFTSQRKKEFYTKLKRIYGSNNVVKIEQDGKTYYYISGTILDPRALRIAESLIKRRKNIEFYDELLEEDGFEFGESVREYEFENARLVRESANKPEDKHGTKEYRIRVRKDGMIELDDVPQLMELLDKVKEIAPHVIKEEKKEEKQQKQKGDSFFSRYPQAKNPFIFIASRSTSLAGYLENILFDGNINDDDLRVEMICSLGEAINKVGELYLDKFYKVFEELPLTTDCKCHTAFLEKINTMPFGKQNNFILYISHIVEDEKEPETILNEIKNYDFGNL